MNVEAHDIEAGRARWQSRYDAARKRDADFTTLSGVEVAVSYTHLTLPTNREV